MLNIFAIKICRRRGHAKIFRRPSGRGSCIVCRKVAKRSDRLSSTSLQRQYDIPTALHESQRRSTRLLRAQTFYDTTAVEEDWLCSLVFRVSRCSNLYLSWFVVVETCKGANHQRPSRSNEPMPHLEQHSA